MQQISYNVFKSPVEITEQGKERISFQYNAALERSHMYYGDEQADKMSRRYRRHYSEDGGMEITNDMQTGKTSFVFYLGGDAYSAPAIWKEEHQGGQLNQNLYYLHRDHLGSIVMITNDLGGVVEKRQFDAWGNIVRIQDGFGNNLAAFVVLDRGYTGHEHLLGVGLIHMNGRLYDPKLHRFLSPDNYVQDPYNTQNFNRFGYAMNNPLMFTDPSGEFLFAFLIPIVGKLAATLITGAVIGAGIGAVSYTASIGLSNGGFNNWNWGQFGKSIGFGAISGVATAGIGSGFGEAGKFGHEVLRGVAHGLAQGGISELSGGNFLTGFASGGLGSLAGSGWGAWGGDFAKSGVGMVAFSAVSGGVGSWATGGDFWQGAGTGAIVAGLNHLAHRAIGDGPQPKNKMKKQDIASRVKNVGTALETIDAMDEVGKKALTKLKLGGIGSAVSAGGEFAFNYFEYADGKIDGYSLATRTGITGATFTLSTKIGMRYGGFAGIAAGTAIGYLAPRAEAGTRLTIMNLRTGFNNFINNVNHAVFNR